MLSVQARTANIDNIKTNCNQVIERTDLRLSREIHSVNIARVMNQIAINFGAIRPLDYLCNVINLE